MTMVLSLLVLAAAALPVPDADEARVLRVGHDLAVANAALCASEGKVAGWSGFLVDSLAYYPASARPAMAERGLVARPRITFVVPGSAADAAGLKPGDIVLTIGGRTLPDRLEKAASYDQQHLLEEAGEQAAVALALERDGALFRTTLRQRPGCASLLSVKSSRKTNAEADGRYAQFTTGLIRAAQSDGELAFYIAHEMAHNVLGHAKRLDAVKWKQSAVRETEEEADRFGLRMMKGAGIDPAIAVSAWQRVSRKGLANLFTGGSHMRDDKRSAFLAAEASRLNAQ